MKGSFSNNDSTDTIASPVTGKQLSFSIRAFCSACGCLISLKSVSAVDKTLSAWEHCKKCGCTQATARYVVEETFYGKSHKKPINDNK